MVILTITWSVWLQMQENDNNMLHYLKISYPDFTVKQHTNRGALDYSWEFKAFKTLMSTPKNNLISI